MAAFAETSHKYRTFYIEVAKSTYRLKPATSASSGFDYDRLYIEPIPLISTWLERIVQRIILYDDESVGDLARHLLKNGMNPFSLPFDGNFRSMIHFSQDVNSRLRDVPLLWESSEIEPILVSYLSDEDRKYYDRRWVPLKFRAFPSILVEKLLGSLHKRPYWTITEENVKQDPYAKIIPEEYMDYSNIFTVKMFPHDTINSLVRELRYYDVLPVVPSRQWPGQIPDTVRNIGTLLQESLGEITLADPRADILNPKYRYSEIIVKLVEEFTFYFETMLGKDQNPYLVRRFSIDLPDGRWEKLVEAVRHKDALLKLNYSELDNQIFPVVEIKNRSTISALYHKIHPDPSTPFPVIDLRKSDTELSEANRIAHRYIELVDEEATLISRLAGVKSMKDGIMRQIRQNAMKEYGDTARGLTDDQLVELFNR